MEMKDFFSMAHLPHIFNHVSKGVEDSGMLYAYQDPLRGYKHGNDGIIFTSIADVYGCGTCRSVTARGASRDALPQAPADVHDPAPPPRRSGTC